MTSRKSEPLTSYKWKKVRRRVFAEESLCWLCGLPVDFKAEKFAPRSPSVDHIIPRSQGGAMYERSNLRLACFQCNSRRGDGSRGQANGPESPSSRRW